MINWKVYNFEERRNVETMFNDIPKNCCLCAFARIYKKDRKTNAVIKLTVAKVKEQYYLKIVSDFSFGPDEIRKDGPKTESTIFSNLLDALDSASLYTKNIIARKLRNDYVVVLQS